LKEIVSLVITGSLMTLSAPLLAVAPELAKEPVNVIAETGTNVEPCPGKGTMAYPPMPYKGRSFFLLRSDARIKSAHDAITSGTPKWIHDLDGPSTDNRMYLAGDGSRILVFSVCLDHHCDSRSLVGTFNLASGEYGLQIREQGKKRVLGSMSAASLAATACADAIHDRLRSEAAAAIRRQMNEHNKK
jgi:hypothetical protein